MKDDYFLFIENSSSSATTIKKWAETRWDSRWTSIQSIIQNYKVLIKSLEELEDNSYQVIPRLMRPFYKVGTRHDSYDSHPHPQD